MRHWRTCATPAYEGVALAIVWAVVPLLFCSHSPASAAGLGVTLAILMTAASVTMAPLALATLVFLAGLGTAIAVQLMLSGTYAAAGGVLLFTVLLGTTCVGRARALVAIRAAEFALAERDETVSLLLREFEDNGRRLAVGDRCSAPRREGVAPLRLCLRPGSGHDQRPWPSCRSWRVRHGRPAISPPACTRSPTS